MDIEVTPWSRTEFFKVKPSVNELIRLHHHLFRHDDFAQVTYAYPFGKNNMANAIKRLTPRKDYEFFLARIQPSNEIIGWIALSFYVEGNKAEGMEKWEANLEWTEMCSHILRHWKIDMAGETSNVWDMIKRASSSLQAKHLPRNYCIINTLVFMPELPESEITNALVKHAIKFWRNRVMLRTEWAIWVQVPHVADHVYRRFGFKELGEYIVNLGNYGFLPREERYTYGEYGWKFMILRGPSGSATNEPNAVWKLNKGKSKEQPQEDTKKHVAAWKPDKSKTEEPLEDEAEHAAARKPGKGKGKDRRLEDQQDEENDPARETFSERDAKRKHDWEEAEKRLEEIRLRRGAPPLPGEVARLVRIQGRTEGRGLNTTSPWEGKSVEQRSEKVRPELPGDPLEDPLQRNAEVTSPPPDNFVPTKSEEDLIEAMRAWGVDEEEIELVKAVALSLTDEADDE